MTYSEKKMTIPRHMEGQRLDQVLEILLPETGLRERKRILLKHSILVDGKKRPKGYRVKQGEVICITLSKRETEPVCHEKIRVVAQNTGFMAALFKPQGVHTVILKGDATPCMEACLPVFWPGNTARLLNRLDFPTSGLILVALSENAQNIYQAYQEKGQVKKTYVALAKGRIEHPLCLKNALVTAGGKQVRVLAQEAEPVRHTAIAPLLYIPDMQATFLRADILKGARHQIRAHLAYSGHPLVGDTLYGDRQAKTSLFLHHYRAELPGFAAKAPPLWPLWSALSPEIKESLHQDMT